jgi:hypothetical protein
VGTTADEGESDVAAIFNETHDKSIAGPFPIVLGEDYAWLAGLWFGAGGIIRRIRGNQRELAVRFRLEEDVYKDLVEVASRLGTAVASWKEGVKKMHPVQMYEARLPSPFYHLFLRLGFPPPIKGVHSRYRKGRNLATNYTRLVVPPFVNSDPVLLRKFVEGYLNTGRFQSWAYEKHPGPGRTHYIFGVDVRFGGYRKEEVIEFAEKVRSVIQSFGIYCGNPRRQHTTRRAYHIAFIISGRASVGALLSTFRLRRHAAQVVAAATRENGNSDRTNPILIH